MEQMYHIKIPSKTCGFNGMLRNEFRYYTKGGMKSTIYGMDIALRIKSSDDTRAM